MFTVKRKSIYYRYLISYILVFIIPLAVLSIFLYRNSVSNIKQEIESFNMSNISQIKDMMDVRIKEMQNIAARVSLDKSLTYYNMVTNRNKVLDGIDELARYQAGNTFVDNILLYFRGSNIVYSVYGSCDINTMTDFTYRLDKNDKNRVIYDIDNISNPVMGVYKSTDNLIYMVPSPPGTGQSYSTILFVIQKKAIQKILSDILHDQEEAVFVIDNQNKLIESSGNSKYIQDAILNEASERRTSGVYSLEYGQDRFSAVTVISEETGWSYSLLIPEYLFFNKVTNVKILILSIIAAISVLGIGLALQLAFINYKPIKKLNIFMKKSFPQLTENYSTDEIENIRNTFVDVIDKYQILNDQVNVQRALVKQNILLRVLKGEFNDKSDLDSALLSCDMKLEGLYFVVFVASFECMDDTCLPSGSKDILLNVINSKSLLNGSAYSVESGNGENIVTVVSISSQDWKSECQQFASKLLEIYNDLLNSRATIGIGKVYGEIMQIADSYLEASAAVGYRQGKINGNIIFFENIAADKIQPYLYSSENEIYLVHGLKQGDRVVTEEALKNLLGEVYNKQGSQSVMRYMCYSILNMITRTLEEMAEKLQDRPEFEELSSTVFRIIEFKSLGEFDKKIHELVMCICDYINNVRKSGNEMQINHIRKYINNNYKDSNISLESVAAHFNFSFYYFSRFFKEQTGSNFSDYMWNLRFEEAKKHLVSTNKSLKDIITEIGYCDVTSFIRKFKSAEGITPGQYRKLYGKSGEAL